MNDTLNRTTSVDVPAGYGIVTAKLIEVMKAGKPDQVITDVKLRDICGRETQPGAKGYTNLLAAIRFCRRHWGMQWKRQRGQNQILCLGAMEVIDTSEKELRKIGKQANLAMETLQHLNSQELSEDEARRRNVLMAQHGAISLCSGRKMSTRLLNDNRARPLDMQKLIEAIQGPDDDHSTNHSLAEQSES